MMLSSKLDEPAQREWVGAWKKFPYWVLPFDFVSTVPPSRRPLGLPLRLRFRKQTTDAVDYRQYRDKGKWSVTRGQRLVFYESLHWVDDYDSEMVHLSRQELIDTFELLVSRWHYIHAFGIVIKDFGEDILIPFPFFKCGSTPSSSTITLVDVLANVEKSLFRLAQLYCAYLKVLADWEVCGHVPAYWLPYSGQDILLASVFDICIPESVMADPERYLGVSNGTMSDMIFRLTRAVHSQSFMPDWTLFVNRVQETWQVHSVVVKLGPSSVWAPSGALSLPSTTKRKLQSFVCKEAKRILARAKASWRVGRRKRRTDDATHPPRLAPPRQPLHLSVEREPVEYTELPLATQPSLNKWSDHWLGWKLACWFRTMASWHLGIATWDLEIVIRVANITLYFLVALSLTCYWKPIILLVLVHLQWGHVSLD